jgi:hypothetical protein
MLRRALEADVSELPVVCKETQSMEHEAHDVGGVRRGFVALRISNHELCHALLAPRVVEFKMTGAYQCRTCEKDQGIIGFVEETDDNFPPLIFPVETPPTRLLAEILSYMHMFRRHGLSNQSKDVWLCMSTTYHVYIRHYLETDPTWNDEIEPLRDVKKMKFSK